MAGEPLPLKPQFINRKDAKAQRRTMFSLRLGVFAVRFI
jgi:hypothetical protein